MVRTGANGLDTIANIEKKKTCSIRLVVKCSDKLKIMERNQSILLPSTVGRHMHFCILEFKVCKICKNSA